MTWTITTTTTISASRAVTLAERIPSEPIKFIVLHPGTGAGGTVTIWDDLGRSVSSTRVDALSPRHEAEFYSDRRIFNVSAAIDGNATLDGAGVSVYLISREAPDASVAGGSTSFAGSVQAPNLGMASGRWAQSIIPQRLPAYTALNNKGLQLTAGQTMLFRRPAPIKQSQGRVLGLKLVCENWDTAAPMNIALAKVATQTAQANLSTATSNGSPVAITWSGAAGVNVPAGARLAGGTLAGDDSPGRVVSDYVALPDVPRTDGGEYALYDFRLLAGASLWFGRRPAATPTGVGPIEFRDQFTFADRVTTWADFTADDGWQCAPMFWVIWYTTTSVVVADLFGDSVILGASTTGGRRSSATLALTSLGIHCNVFAKGAALSTSTAQIIETYAGTEMANGKIAVMKCASEVNDSTNAPARWYRFLEAYQELRAQGRIVLVLGPTPYDAAHVDTLRTMLSESGIPWFDFIPHMGVDSRHFKPGYSEDAIHPNNTAVDAAFPAFSEWCRMQLLSAGF